MEKKALILIVDDEQDILDLLSDILQDAGYETLKALDAQSARQLKKAHNPDLILLDIWLPDTDGITLLGEWSNEQSITQPIIMMSGHGTIETAVQATKLGADDFIEKPLSIAKLQITIERCLAAAQLQRENTRLKAQLNPPIDLGGKSSAMQDLRQRAQALAARNTPVLLFGEAGSGKKHFARYLHQESQNTGDFITMYVSSLDDAEMKSTLQNLLEEAQNGTLYLDEASELNGEAQNLLCHFLEQQEHAAQRSLRIIAAVRCPPATLPEKLQPELYYLLNIAPITVPPLREHSEDVPELLNHFSQYFADFEKLPYRHFSLAAQNTLRQHLWPGNVRELKNLVQRLLVLDDKPEISQEEAESALQLPQADANLSAWIPQDLSFREAREMFEREYLRKQLQQSGGNIAHLAERIDMERTNLYRKLRSLGLKPTKKG